MQSLPRAGHPPRRRRPPGRQPARPGHDLRLLDPRRPPRARAAAPPTRAHMLGFRGHYSTRSRCYSTTLTALRQARRDWRDQRLLGALGRPVEGKVVRHEGQRPAQAMRKRSSWSVTGSTSGEGTPPAKPLCPDDRRRPLSEPPNLPTNQQGRRSHTRTTIERRDDSAKWQWVQQAVGRAWRKSHPAWLEPLLDLSLNRARRFASRLLLQDQWSPTRTARRAVERLIADELPTVADEGFIEKGFAS